MPGSTPGGGRQSDFNCKRNFVSIYRPAAIEREIEAVRANDQTGTQNNRLYIAVLKIGALLAVIGQADADTIAGATAEMPTLDCARPWNRADGKRTALKAPKVDLTIPRDRSGPAIDRYRDDKDRE